MFARCHTSLQHDEVRKFVVDFLRIIGIWRMLHMGCILQAPACFTDVRTYDSITISIGEKRKRAQALAR